MEGYAHFLLKLEGAKGMKEALDRIKAAENQNLQLEETLKADLKTYESEKQQALQEYEKEYQEKYQAALLKIEEQFEESLLQEKKILEREQLKTEKDNQLTYEKNKDRIITYILKKVRENNGS